MPSLPLRSPAVAPGASGEDPRPRSHEVERSTDVWDWLLGAAIVVGLVALTHATLFSQVLRPLITDVESSRWGLFVERPSVLWTTMGTILLGIRTVLWFRYRPAPPVTMADAPALTVIIPAYNEGSMVGDIHRLGRGLRVSPREARDHRRRRRQHRRHLGAHPARRRAPPGRRHHRPLPGEPRQARGPRRRLPPRARGEIVVTIDSDSVDRAGRAPRDRGAVPRSQGRRGGGAGRGLQPRRRDHPADAPRPLRPLVRLPPRGAVDLRHRLLLPGRALRLPHLGSCARSSTRG